MTTPEPKTSGIKHLDIGFGWLLTYEYLPHWLDFKAYEITGISVGSRMPGAELPSETFYRDKDLQPTTDLALAEPTLTGFVKWDGCCEVYMDTHVCSVEMMQQLTQVLLECHRLCLLLPSVDLDCAGYDDPLDTLPG